jgi:hypothetical protein
MHQGFIFALIAGAGFTVHALDSLQAQAGRQSTGMKSNFVQLATGGLVCANFFSQLSRSGSAEWFVGEANGSPLFANEQFWKATSDLNLGLLHVGSCEDATGVIVQTPAHDKWDQSANPYVTGGFSYLHVPIPIAMMGANQLTVYPPTADQTHCFFPAIGVADSQAWALDNAQFNYAVVHKKAMLPLPGFELEEKIGDVTVLRRVAPANFTAPFYKAYLKGTYGWLCYRASADVESAKLGADVLYQKRFGADMLRSGQDEVLVVRFAAGSDMHEQTRAFCEEHAERHALRDCEQALMNDAARLMTTAKPLQKAPARSKGE